MSKQDYKTLNQELDKVLSDLQAGDLDVEEAVALYEKGMKITKQLQEHLKQAENKVSKIKADFAS